MCQRLGEGRADGLRLWCTAGVHPHDSGAVEGGYIDELRALHAAVQKRKRRDFDEEVERRQRQPPMQPPMFGDLEGSPR